MKDKKIKVADNSMVYFNDKVLGIDGENLQGKIIFYFENFKNGVAWLEFEKEDGTKAYLFPRIRINGVDVAKEIASKSENTTRYQAVTFTPFLISVSEGDLITLSSGEISPNNKGTIRGYDNGSLCTYMTVEVIE